VHRASLLRSHPPFSPFPLPCARRWEKPADFGGAGASGWTAVKDPTSGKTYYHNTGTGATSWEKPAGFVDPADVSPPPKEQREVTARAEPRRHTACGVDNIAISRKARSARRSARSGARAAPAFTRLAHCNPEPLHACRPPSRRRIPPAKPGLAALPPHSTWTLGRGGRAAAGGARNRPRVARVEPRDAADTPPPSERARIPFPSLAARARIPGPHRPPHAPSSLPFLSFAQASASQRKDKVLGKRGAIAKKKAAQPQTVRATPLCAARCALARPLSSPCARAWEARFCRLCRIGAGRPRAPSDARARVPPSSLPPLTLLLSPPPTHNPLSSSQVGEKLAARAKKFVSLRKVEKAKTQPSACAYSARRCGFSRSPRVVPASHLPPPSHSLPSPFRSRPQAWRWRCHPHEGGGRSGPRGCRARPPCRVGGRGPPRVRQDLLLRACENGGQGPPRSLIVASSPSHRRLRT
jgi:hypothetical protein